MKRHFWKKGTIRSPGWPGLGIALVLAVAAQVPVSGQETSPGAKSVIVEVTDPTAELQELTEVLEKLLGEAGSVTEAWLQAEKAHDELQADPDNHEKKLQAIHTKAHYLGEFSARLREAVEKGALLDEVYATASKQLDAQMTEARSALERTVRAEEVETSYLKECLAVIDQLNRIQHLAGPQVLDPPGVEPGKSLTENELQTLNDVDTVLSTVEISVANLRNARDIEDRRLVLIMESKLIAARRYADCARAVTMAKADVRAFDGILSTDLAYVQTLELEQQVRRQREQPAIEYGKDPKPEFLTGNGYRFSELSGAGPDHTTTPPVLSPERTERLRALVGNQEGGQ